MEVSATILDKSVSDPLFDIEGVFLLIPVGTEDLPFSYAKPLYDGVAL